MSFKFGDNNDKEIIYVFMYSYTDFLSTSLNYVPLYTKKPLLKKNFVSKYFLNNIYLRKIQNYFFFSIRYIISFYFF